MTREEFNELLKNAGLKKVDFCNIFGISQASVSAWGRGGRGFPYWVKSWLENYIAAKYAHESVAKESFERLDRLVVGWAAKRGILQNSTVKDQFVKVVEEVGEMAAAIARDDKEALKDAVGDTLVTLILTARMSGLDPVDCLESAWEQIKDRAGEMRDGIFVKDEA